jgi:hypothetical protein
VKVPELESVKESASELESVKESASELVKVLVLELEQQH